MGRGKAVEVQKLTDNLIALGGVRSGKLAMSSTGEHLH